MDANATTPPSGKAAAEDWTTKVTDLVEHVVALARDHSLRPALTVLRFVLVGLVGLGLGILMFVLGVVGIVRLLTSDLFAGRVWASDLFVGGLCILLALALFGIGRRFARPKAVGNA